MDKIKLIEQIEKYVILITVFLYPIFFLTNFVNIFETPKLMLLVTSSLILVLLKIIKFSIKKEFHFNSSKFDLFVIFFLIATAISATFSIANKVDAFFLPGNASFIILACIFFFLINQLNESSKKAVVTTLLASGFIVAIMQIFSSFGITKLINFLPEVIKLTIFTPLGNILSSIVFLVTLTPILLFKIIKNKDISERILSSLVLIIFLVSIGSSIFQILPNKETSIKILNPKYSWSIAVDTLKTNPFFGVGPSNFGHSFNRFRPIEYNNQKDWNVKYIQGSSFALTLVTELGVLGIVTVLYLLFLVYKHKELGSPTYISILVFVISLIFLPVSTTLLFILFIYLSIFAESKSSKLGYFASKIPQLLIVVPALLTTLGVAYLSTRAFWGELVFSNAIKSLNKNEAISAYDSVNKAVSINPYSDRYHLFSASINLALAESLAQKENLSDDDRKKVSQLIQQAIREGKAAVAVNRYKSSNWEAISDVYKTIMSFAKGSDVFAIESLKQAIALDPINPNLRLKLGSLYYSQKNMDLAIDNFKLATLAKPDFANGHYNLAIAYKENKQLEKAKEEMNITLSLVGKESNDYEKALKELQNIEELSKPEEKIEPVIEPQLELPQE